MTVHPPSDKQKKHPPLSLTVIHAWERGKPEGQQDLFDLAPSNATATLLEQ
jgi:hypothetical protein